MSPEYVWAAGDLYEPYVGRWSRLVAEEFVRWLAVPEWADWLDVGCGTGALSQTILNYADPKSVVGVDPSPDFVGYAAAHTQAPHASFRVGSAEDIPVGTSSVDVCVAGLVLNFVSDPAVALAEMKRAARPGGIVAVYVWDYADKMELMRYFWDAAVELDPDAGDLDEGPRFPLCDPERLESAFAAAGLLDVEVRPIDVPTTFRDFDDYWTPFLGGQGPAPTYAVSLGEEPRNALRDRVRDALPIEHNGSINLIARAWAAKGVVT